MPYRRFSGPKIAQNGPNGPKMVLSEINVQIC